MHLLFFKIKMSLRWMLIIVVGSAICMTVGCATPVGVTRVNEKVVYEQIDSSALTSSSYSSYTAVVLHRHGLEEADFLNDPEKLIRNLHEIAVHDGRRDLLLSLSELCFLAAQQAEFDQSKQIVDNRELYYSPLEPDVISPTHEPIHPRTYYMGSAVYAYLFLMGPGSEPPPGAFDRRFRLACDLYNRSLANILTFVDGKIELSDKFLPLPVGGIHVTIKNLKMPWDTAELETVLPADAFAVHGLSVRNRVPGMGAPILAVRKKGPGKPVSSAVPATVFVEIKGGLDDIKTGNCSGEASIYSTMSESEIMVGDKKIPLETDLTAPIAYSLNDPILWSLGLNLIRMGRSLFEPGIYPVQPHEPGLIPIVLVHGTASSPVWWAEMLNTLRSDPQIRKHFQIWLYLYDSGKPVAFSASHLRESIEKKIKTCDPSGQDPALKNIVVIGHSQGGLLTRYTAIETGDTIVKAILGKSLNELDLSPEQMELVKQYAVIHPLPEVRRVVFISTPHRGSILASSFVRRMAVKLITLPKEIVQTGTELFSIFERFSPAGKLKWSMATTSIDSMSPDNPSLLAVAGLPFPPGIKGHSIIAIKGDEQPPEGDDGVVAYKSAHIEGVESELVVRDGHSCQGNPVVIEEVRRILIEHLNDLGIYKNEGPRL
jgi:pimeloyl-ACP methyl ester carboxylesterase